MIIHNNHFDRYSALMDLYAANAPFRASDPGYISALYILSADDDLYRLSLCHIDSDGINFSKIRSCARRGNLSAAQMTLLGVAGSLFNESGKAPTPHDLAQCSYCVLGIIVNALYLWKNGRTIQRADDASIAFDASAEVIKHASECQLNADRIKMLAALA